MGHIDRTLNNLDAMKKLAATGINLEFDLFGMEVCFFPHWWFIYLTKYCRFPTIHLVELSPCQMTSNVLNGSMNCARYCVHTSFFIFWASSNQMVQSGLRDQIVVSHDVYSKHRLLAFGGHGYRHLPGNLSTSLIFIWSVISLTEQVQ